MSALCNHSPGQDDDLRDRESASSPRRKRQRRQEWGDSRAERGGTRVRSGKFRSSSGFFTPCDNPAGDPRMGRRQVQAEQVGRGVCRQVGVRGQKGLENGVGAAG